ncbi:GNAT domain-containing protein [Colletotrichum godetiae]|uniref:GNAT domain-containing protein n=1 Tax=Colletotrichum godetiae TaxID=1209918 RepID=A0AAJ0ATU4_9PEZI|nr:GNAT domain-containing protein [Colletotrichum godetiae]KAK1690225.1 GNAT domain-containing protein [Colletotrichum godetiae]
MDEQLDFITVNTTLPTLPLPPLVTRQPVLTERLILKPVSQDDLHAVHAMRSQPEVMRWAVAGRPDADLQETQAWLDDNLPPNDAHNYNFTICLRSTGEFVGLGGVKRISHGSSSSGPGGELGWPEIGYLLRQEAWGKGYATEFLRGFVGAWWSLPRSAARALRVEKSVIGETWPVQDAERSGSEEVAAAAEEMLTAVTELDNLPSQKVLNKTGFRKFKVWTEVDKKTRETTTLVGYGIAAPK